MARNKQKTDGTSPAGPSSPDGAMTTNPAREQIAMRAYELYMARGGSDGQEVEDWLAAERELRDRSGSTSSSER